MSLKLTLDLTDSQQAALAAVNADSNTDPATRPPEDAFAASYLGDGLDALAARQQQAQVAAVCAKLLAKAAKLQPADLQTLNAVAATP